MTAKIIDGESIAAEVRTEVRAHVDRLRTAGVRPGLTVVIAGDDAASLTYVQAKSRACLEVGIACDTIRLPGHLCQDRLLELIAGLNVDAAIHGILVQQPLPNQISAAAVVGSVTPGKDVDGLHPLNLGLLLQGRPNFIPCTAAAVQELLLRSGHDPAGKRVVIVGRSNLVGRPLAVLLMERRHGGDATVCVCHRQTPNLAGVTREADILVAAAGRPGLVTGDMVRTGAVVIDVGMSRVPDASRKRGYRLAGDVDFESVSEKARAITPVPGGVGPMTVAMLLANTVRAAEAAAERRREAAAGLMRA
ncbi:MAG TPA: bifunctional 5,10-methylenetetrahydrofolate dehydrogenase/5,10-methenyltetrahydrofolate cyclohydrolase [Dehalococcoidia bacterium]|nr:bifunctional 5,10-methylenetetrahydrofolate dehydrogenase/5,10-methenyltetrahydrofolate cyclohydrolase [Dehalococcoidia bacterium]